MRRAIFLILIILCVYISGCCSIPSVANYEQLYSYARIEKKVKVGISKRKMVIVKDFRENDSYEEDMIALKEDVEKYISDHPQLSDTTKNNLRDLKVSLDLTKQEVELLLGTPDKITRAGANNKYKATEIWVYRINRWRAFTVFFIPIFFVREGYYLYFKDDILVGIERHYLKQIVQQHPGAGVIEKGDKDVKTK